MRIYSVTPQQAGIVPLHNEKVEIDEGAAAITLPVNPPKQKGKRETQTKPKTKKRTKSK